MKYKVIITESDIPLAIGVLTNKGRIKYESDQYWIIGDSISNSFKSADLKPISIQLAGMVGNSICGKEYDVSEELADSIIRANASELEEDKDFELKPLLITFSGNDLGEEGKDWKWEAVLPSEMPQHSEKLYVWLDITNGNFSDSWDAKTHELLTTEDILKFAKKGLKLIEYTCLNDAEFQFYNKMKLK